ncbi:hypothetical protein MUP59_04770 [Candidatus Bathyarchaeota archaeon]|nr:hypothetical protein [Candidatus Bathyarchaeota archaeon]
MSLIDRVNELLDYNPETGKLIWKKVTSNRAKVGGEAGPRILPNMKMLEFLR